MEFVDLLLIGVGLSMDAFAGAICKGLCMPRLNVKQAVVIALFFGGFQALMPAIGWALGTQFASFVTSFSHWIAFILLAFIGGKMLWDVFHEDKEDAADNAAASASAGEKAGLQLDIKQLFLLAIATSIDALAVGISFAFLQVDIVPSVSIIGVTTFVISFAGVAVGHVFGSRYERPAQIVGGIVLIGIGLKILLEGLL